jgi:hypothetical protein
MMGALIEDAPEPFAGIKDADEHVVKVGGTVGLVGVKPPPLNGVWKAMGRAWRCRGRRA